MLTSGNGVDVPTCVGTARWITLLGQSSSVHPHVRGDGDLVTVNPTA